MLTSGLVTVKVTTVPSPDMANRLTLSYKGYDFKQNKVIFFKSQISALHFGHLEHPLLGNPLLMTKDEVRLRISVHRLVGFGAPVDSLQVSETRPSSCNEAFVEVPALMHVEDWATQPCFFHLLFGLVESSIFEIGEMMTPDKDCIEEILKFKTVH